MKVECGRASGSGKPVRRRQVLWGAAGLGAAAWLGPVAARAAASYLDGRTLQVISGFSEGSNGNILMQEFSRALERLLPDTRVAYRVNPGGTAALTAAMLAESEPDGLTIGIVDMDSLVAKTTGAEVYDISEFSIVGGMDRDADMLISGAASDITSVDDLVGRDTPAIQAVRSTSSGAYFQGYLLNAVLQTRILPVTGYDSGARELAIRTGEADLVVAGVPNARRLVNDGAGQILLRLTDVPLPSDFGDVPALSDFDATEEFEWVVDFLNTSAVSHILGAPKDTPADRLQTLRELFTAAVADPEFVQAATNLLVLEPIPGQEIEALIQRLLSGFDSFAEGLAAALACGMQLAETGESCRA